MGDYRTIASGDFHDTSIWEVWDGFSWSPAGVKPGSGNSIFIDQGHEVRLVQQEEVHHVYLFSAALPGRKLNLQTFELHVYGFLSGMQKVGGLFAVNSVTNATLDWIYPETGKIVFKGSSRTVVDRASWSANTTNSRYTVVFDPDPGQTLVVNSAFKANAFIIQSGTVRQTVNTAGIPACSTFSFNNQTVFNGTGPYGDFIIEPGARLISDCSAPLASMIQRSGTVPGLLFELKAGASLFLTGNDPLLDVAQVQLNGNVYYSAVAGTQRMLRNSLPASTLPKTYHNLLLENNGIKIFQDSVFIDGDLAVLSGPVPNHGNGFVRFFGSGVQQIVGDGLVFFDLEISKQGGSLRVSNDLNIQRFFYMKDGLLDFQGVDLRINESGLGALLYKGGTWLNLHRIFYSNIPTVLTASNATFPLEDVYQGGIRRIRLVGDSPGGDLQLSYVEIPGANWNPNFSDSDGTPILYQLNSYVEFSGLNPGSSTIELLMSAENLVVDQVEDLRIVSNGQAAPGTNLLAVDVDTLWARREIPFSLLDNQSFTIGSYRVLSVLPLQWKSQAALWKDGMVKIRWETFDEENTAFFIIRKSVGGVDKFEEVGRVEALGQATNAYEFTYALRQPARRTFFQLEQLDKDGQGSFSRVFRLEGVSNYIQMESFKSYPNPYTQGPLIIELPNDWALEKTNLKVIDAKGFILFYGALKDFDATHILGLVGSGVYIFSLEEEGVSVSFKLVKK
ncbi:T9SS type A sorting domain-containing protein [Mongoliitalea daihaiensis]|uniref:T9SS type A sorting domain-containing protein n=1 Tax=Mongoliitalea daihaiensis TaxID=2782006 RepID=UPI001F1E35CB|nr:T9SS type A sorting domain-containing protein [Mongoliitalea daihaiensis]UJP66364.1 T9SS type A sorting domain-containing protein [Mongoliitalea daihaiensis]